MLQRVRERAHDASAAVLNRPSGRSLQSYADYIEMVSFALQPRKADEKMNDFFVRMM